MFKTAISLIIILAIFTLISVLIPDSFTQTIDDAVIYFLSSIWALNIIIDVNVLMTCLEIIVNFLASTGIFWILYYLLNIIK